MICEKCGANIPDDSDYCLRCGTDLRSDAVMAETSEQLGDINAPAHPGKAFSLIGIIIGVSVFIHALYNYCAFITKSEAVNQHVDVFSSFDWITGPASAVIALALSIVGVIRSGFNRYKPGVVCSIIGIVVSTVALVLFAVLSIVSR